MSHQSWSCILPAYGYGKCIAVTQLDVMVLLFTFTNFLTQQHATVSIISPTVCSSCIEANTGSLRCRRRALINSRIGSGKHFNFALDACLWMTIDNETCHFLKKIGFGSESNGPLSIHWFMLGQQLAMGVIPHSWPHPWFRSCSQKRCLKNSQSCYLLNTKEFTYLLCTKP